MNNSKKCQQCGLVNFATDDRCRRCSANLDAPARALPPTSPTISKSTVYVCLLVLFLGGLGVWGYWHKQGTDRELKEKAEWMRRQNDYAGQGVNSGPAEGTSAPANAEQVKNAQRIMEEIKKREEQQRAFYERARKETVRPPQ